MNPRRRRTVLSLPIALLFALGMAWVSQAWALKSPADGEPVVLVVGDSLSAAFGIAIDEGWVHLLQDRLHERDYPHRVVNASISGDTSAGGLNRLPAALEHHQPSIVILELGANDALRGQSLTRLQENLEAMILMSKEHGAEVLLLGMLIPPNYGPVYSRRFLEVYPQLAETHDVGLVPFFLDGVATEPALMLADGLHPNALAQPTILNNVWWALETLLQSE